MSTFLLPLEKHTEACGIRKQQFYLRSCYKTSITSSPTLRPNCCHSCHDANSLDRTASVSSSAHLANSSFSIQFRAVYRDSATRLGAVVELGAKLASPTVCWLAKAAEPSLLYASIAGHHRLTHGASPCSSKLHQSYQYSFQDNPKI